jgi:hypothetical protein
MSTFAVRAIGFCAHYSRQGDWAFEFALRLARAGSLRLNVFHFLVDPYDPEARPPAGLTSEERAALAIRLERDLRIYYDARLGDYLDAGFRLCEDPEWTELHRCLTKREFQVLVLGYPHERARFGGLPIEEFVSRFVSPVVLVGPGSRRELRLNPPAALISDRLGLAEREYASVRPLEACDDAECPAPRAALEAR